MSEKERADALAALIAAVDRSLAQPLSKDERCRLEALRSGYVRDLQQTVRAA